MKYYKIKSVFLKCFELHHNVSTQFLSKLRASQMVVRLAWSSRSQSMQSPYGGSVTRCGLQAAARTGMAESALGGRFWMPATEHTYSSFQQSPTSACMMCILPGFFRKKTGFSRKLPDFPVNFIGTLWKILRYVRLVWRMEN
jgi:hypothetical protein